ncbi:MAG: hypothetical protein CMN76_02450 [Spirochaetaceae bacterium]|nr:hypothetical protein [Spirochaetaceae bacterium]|tara:strand:- start:92 stop:1273 length:1182 start_codon:yes stop_codon:yes gene_type:complete
MRSVTWLTILFLGFCTPESSSVQADSPVFPEIYKGRCLNNAGGCPCYSEPDASASIRRTYPHAQSLRKAGAEKEKDGKVYVPVVRNAVIAQPGDVCYVEKDHLISMKYSPVLESKLQQLDHTPLTLDQLVDLPGKVDSLSGEGFQHIQVRKVWPTYYHLAMEEFHPGQKVPVRNPAGKTIGYASQDFQEQVRWEGSGVALDGKKYHYAGRPGQYNNYNLRWGHGAGYNYQVFPYRTIAVSFPGLCKSLRSRIKNCAKRTLIGLMVYIPEVAEKNIQMPGGKTHDGYFCITDTGSPYYIREDRIDMFVGTHGGGNPYLPEKRQRNHLIDGGIANLVPSDWKIWTTDTKRVWCDVEAAMRGDCTHDYRNTAKEKALTLKAVFTKDGRPVRCRKNP